MVRYEPLHSPYRDLIPTQSILIEGGPVLECKVPPAPTTAAAQLVYISGTEGPRLHTMQHSRGSDFLDAGALSRSRSTSLSSDSQHPRVNLMSPPSVRPQPAFISSSAASEIITSDQEFNAADFVAEEETGAGANALLTPAALSLLNGFLDNLLFNILAASKSTQLTCIRPILADVLKPRLASEVVSTADEELSEYMGGGDDEETEFRGGQEPGGDFDLIRSWKLTRLRCMVYTRLGDMEEEDEDEYITQEGLRECDGAPRRFSSHVDNVTPAAAIFLTSIIEHIGERALVIAGETARSRLSSKLNHGDDDSIQGEDRKRIDRLVVEDLDMEKLALNATLGRLWRTWRKRRRAATISRTVSRESLRRRGHSTHTLANSRKSSIATIEEPVTPHEPLPAELPAPLDPATVPLPMNDHDVQEIEVPGFSPEMEGEVQTMEAMVAHKVRPRSLMVFSSPSLVSKSRDGSPVSASAVENPKSLRHARSRSLPNAPASPPSEVQAEDATPEQPSPSASEKNRQLETMYEDDESAEYVDAAESAPGIAITTANEDSEEPVVDTPEKVRMSVVHEEEEPAAPAVDETIDSLRAGGDDDELVTDQSNSAQVSVSSVSDQPTTDAEVIEGQGMCEKPKLVSTIQRPKRKSSRDVSQSNVKSIIAATSEPDMQPVVETPQSTQGTEPTPTPPAATIEAINYPNDNEIVNDGNQDKSAMAATAVPVTVPPNDSAASEKPREPALTPETPRPDSTSGDSERSQRSRTRHRPTPLVVPSGNRSSPGIERAAVQRMPRPSTSISSIIQTKSRRSESFSSARDKRPVTAGSTTSQVSSKLKGLMVRPQAESSSLRLRSSSETSRASGSGDSMENETTDLDKLINSDETIHFTLTPRSVREMTFPEIPRPIPRSDTADTSDLAHFLKNTAPPGDEPRPRTSVSSRATGEFTSIGRTKSTESPKHIPISPRMPMSPKLPMGQAREARAAGDSTREFAEFIKSTGPPGPPSVPRKNSSPAPEMPRTIRPSTTTRSSNKLRLQARPAETSGSQTSDLIDFIREGPPQPGAHRIPRAVAPFRNTIDSDDIRLDHNDKDRTTRSSLTNTQDSSTPDKSQTSLESRAGLLGSAYRSNAKARATASKAPSAQEDALPGRKQRRVRDPYSIDDDDDELLEELMNEKPQREEESLMDFLRSAPPPDFEQQTPKPLNVNVPASSGSSGFDPLGMRARLMRSSTDKGSSKGPSSKKSISSLRSQTTLNNAQPQSTYSIKVGLERNPGTIPSTSHRPTETSALADFLRNTGPPEPPVPRTQTSPMSSKIRDSTLSRFFVRRRKVEV
ncbi:uncharacterized protein N7459_009415 [Penicillium hispanicum]|uniref:uncharacterized protein n=1 Tax=Penicillium hispanicum TaxID=1080232 RepID=UPI0025400364|nr:uncharacterized protein N7459_009415 [Penicillium hispanicum]KAJ5569985.1 hypothetical protein N7459_009415 [Penicillium hispanicum]